MGTKPPRKNRYKKKAPEKHPARTFRHAVGIAFKSLFLALVMVGMSLVFILIHDVLTQCQYFSAENIEVSGGSRLSREEILETAEIQMGVNLVSLNLRAVRNKLLAHPWIAEADVRRTFPKQIDIRITEQAPVAVLDFGKQFLINGDGVIFKEAHADEIPGLPVLSGIDYTDWRRPDTVQSPVFASVMDILRLGSASDGILPNTRIKTIQVDREMGVTLDMAGPVKMVKLGYGRYSEKYSRLEKIYAWMGQAEAVPFIETLDLRNPERIVARPGNEKLSEEDQKEV